MRDVQHSEHSYRALAVAVALGFLLTALYVPSFANGEVISGGFSPSNTYSIEVTGTAYLHSNLTAGNLIIEPGAVLYTDGYSIVLNGTFNNMGTVQAGLAGNSPWYTYRTTNYPDSYGGSGGGIVYQNSVYLYGAGSTRVASGISSDGIYNNSVNGSSPGTPPSFSTAVIHSWWNSGIQQYLIGAAGGCGYSYSGSGGFAFAGSGSFGVYIQASNIIAGKINANGQSVNSSMQVVPDLSSGGGGGGLIVLAYGSGGYSKGIYDVSGGTSAIDSNNSNFPGGNGGNGQVLTLNYTSSGAPVSINYPYSGGQLFDGAYANYSISIDESSASVNAFSLTGSAMYRFSNVSVPLDQVSVQYNYSVPGDTLYSGTSHNSYNISLSSVQDFNSFVMVNETNLISLDHKVLPSSLASDLGFKFSSIGIPLAGVTGVNTTVSVPAGNFYADEISGTLDSGGTGTVWVSSNTGVMLKAQGSQPLYSGYSLQDSYSLSSTNIPVEAVQPSYTAYIIAGIIAAVVIAGLIIADRMGYVNLRDLSGKIKASFSKEEKLRREKMAKLDRLRQQNLITEEEYNERIKTLK